MNTAKIFKSGNSQAVRLPKEFQFDVSEVEIFRRGDEVVLRRDFEFSSGIRVVKRLVGRFYGKRTQSAFHAGKGTVLILMLDTDICIYIIKRKPGSVLKRLESLQPGQLAMSAITLRS